MQKIWCEKYLYFGISLYDQNKHWYFGKKNHVMIRKFCQKYGLLYVDNRNIQRKHLYKDGFHLMEEGKNILARNLIFYLNKAMSNYFLDYNFLDKHIHHPFVNIRRNTFLNKQVYNNYKKTDQNVLKTY